MNNKRNNYKKKGSNPRQGKHNAPDDNKNKDISRKAEAYDNMKTNDISWYNKMSNLFARATQLPFNRIVGDNMAEPELSFNNYTSDNAWMRHSVPLLMRINYVPGIGVCNDYNDAPNRAFQAMYSALLTKTSTSVLPFTAANLGLYTVCAQSIAQNIGLAKRLIETARVYTPDNYGLPRAYLAAQMGTTSSGWSEEIADLINNIGKYEWELNNIIRDFNSLRIPNFIDTFKRQYLLTHSYFMDNDTVASQAYVFVPETYFLFSDKGRPHGAPAVYDGIACAESRTLRLTSMESLMEVLRAQLSNLRSSKDFTSINGTLKRAFEEADFVFIDELVGNETPNLIVDEVMAYQIHNMTICHVDTEEQNDIKADYERDIITYNPYSYGSNALCGAQSFILNTFDNSVSPDWIMESTRLITSESDDHSIYACGTEIVTNCQIISLTYDDKGKPLGAWAFDLLPDYFDYGDSGKHIDEIRRELAFILPALEKFHRAPRFAIYGTTHIPANNDFGFEEAKTIISVTGDLHFYTFASRDAVKRLHDTALLSIFDTAASMRVK